MPCITQGFLSSVYHFKRCDQLPELVEWMAHMRGVVATDPERMWAEDADVLTATLEPGFMLQAPRMQPYVLRTAT